MDNYQALISEGVEVKNSLSGTLRLGLGVAAAAAFMPTLIKPLIKKNANITLKLFETDNDKAQSGLVNGDYDAIIFLSDNVKPGFQSESLMDAPLYLIAPSGFFPETQKSVNLSELHKKPMVLLNGPVISEYYNSIFDENNIRPKIVATAKTNQMVRSLVGAGLGCSILNLKGASVTTAAGDNIREIPIEGLARPMGLTLGYKEEYQRKLVKAFVEECRKYFQSSQAKEFLIS